MTGDAAGGDEKHRTQTTGSARKKWRMRMERFVAQIDDMMVGNLDCATKSVIAVIGVRRQRRQQQQNRTTASPDFTPVSDGVRLFDSLPKLVPDEIPKKRYFGKFERFCGKKGFFIFYPEVGFSSV